METLPLIRRIQNSKPKKTNIFTASLDGVSTDFIIIRFKNNITYLILQSPAIGNLYHVKVEELHRNSSSDPAYDIIQLQGIDNIEMEAGIRYIAGQLTIRKSMIFGMNLKNYKVDTLKLIVEALKTYDTSSE